MRLRLILISLALQFNLLYAQENIWIDCSGFESVFQNNDSGLFKGTINGILIID
jgi:hypothetical protein